MTTLISKSGQCHWSSQGPGMISLWNRHVNQPWVRFYQELEERQKQQWLEDTVKTGQVTGMPRH